MSFPLRPEGLSIPGRGVEPAAAVLAQEADDIEDTLLGRESRLCWFCHESGRSVRHTQPTNFNILRECVCVSVCVRAIVLPVDGIWLGMCSHGNSPGWGGGCLHCSVA